MPIKCLMTDYIYRIAMILGVFGQPTMSAKDRCKLTQSKLKPSASIWNPLVDPEERIMATKHSSLSCHWKVDYI
jgi:hypothetical protein